MKRIKSTFLALVVLLSPMAANADLIDAGGSTIDTLTGLEWLDLTSTVGMTVANALAAFEGDGYQYANDSEIATLLASFGITYGFNPGTYFDLGATLAQREFFVGLFGATTGVGAAEMSFGGFELLGLGRSAYLCISISACGPRSFTNDIDTSGGRFSFAGQFLVRRATSVPEPGTLALFGIGLIGMGLARRRKNA